MKQAIECRAETWRENGRWHIRVELPVWVAMDTYNDGVNGRGSVIWREKEIDAQPVSPETETLSVVFILTDEKQGWEDDLESESDA